MLDANEIGRRAKGLHEQLRRILVDYDEEKDSYRTRRYKIDEALEKERAILEARHKAALATCEARYARERTHISENARCRIEAEVKEQARRRSQIVRERELAAEKFDSDLRLSSERILAEDQRKANCLAAELDKVEARIEPLRSWADKLVLDLKLFASQLGFRPKEKPEISVPDIEIDADPWATLESVDWRLATVAEDLQACRKSFWSLAAHPVASFVVSIAIVLLNTSVWLFRPQYLQTRSHWMVLAGVIIGSLVAVRLLAWVGRKVTGARAERVNRGLAEAFEMLAQQKTAARARYKRISQELLDERIERLLAVEEDLAGRASEARRRSDVELARAEAQHDDAVARVRKASEQVLQERRSAFADAMNGMKLEHRRAIKSLEAELWARMRSVDEEKHAAHESLAGRWRECLKVFADGGREHIRACSARQPIWSPRTVRNWTPTTDLPGSLPVGRVEVGLDQVDIPENCDATFSLPEGPVASFPLELDFPERGSLVLRSDAESREKSLAVLLNSALRSIASFPPGMARFTLVDPVALGRSFSALMQLTDYDEDLVGKRVWTDATQIERQLNDLTAHMEKVIQKYLRSRYASIAEYNDQAGELKEPFRFLVIADFPTGFSDLALERLSAILNSGAKCGVHVLMLHDARQKWPDVIDIKRLRRHGLILTGKGGAFVPDHEGLRRSVLVPEFAPPADVSGPLLDRVGREARLARRVELDFRIAAPSREACWSLRADSGLRVPVGRSGADRLQYLDLGRGTNQHALIAGRTGSGKSTLFHVMITNTALWYSPRDVEFYLIDFKKGVEFKTFATHRLPHARVVAIESDREFGLSVLKRIDQELDRRGELFRSAGVQDLRGYHESGVGEQLPRTLLMIDEFQEFFIEDDAIAQEAALLLDRFVRQGRAFGVHVVLGSQTLSGVYSLAKSTLGQIGVRIALQCNEADSYLILSEDNAAGRLLSRPGEAIYNDQGGLVEGNSPFQVVWLPDDTESAYLNEVAAKATRDGWEPVRPMVVFEGNAPAQLGNNPLLRELLVGDGDPIAVLNRAWLGEPNAIKGPTEARFAPASGSNLLMVGQRPDAAFAQTSSAIISIAAGRSPEEVRFVMLGASDRASERAGQLVDTMRAIPHEIEVIDNREIHRVVAELDEQISSGENRAATGHTTFLFVFGLQRLRALRLEDEFAFPGHRENESSTGRQFANILREGPPQNIYTVVWCDSLNNLNRSLGRRMLREFDMCVLFQMSASDSAELIDAPIAGTLGLHNALLAVESDGIFEKYRPYGYPDEEWLASVREALGAKYGN